MSAVMVTGPNTATQSLPFLADHTATRYDRLLALSCRPSVRPALCNAVHSGSQGRCAELKVVPACS